MLPQSPYLASLSASECPTRAFVRVRLQRSVNARWAAISPDGETQPGRAGCCLGVARLTEDEMRKRLEMLRIEHRDLDAAIDALSGTGAHDQLQVARLKKRKLRLKDQIALLEDYLIPDIIA